MSEMRAVVSEPMRLHRYAWALAIFWTVAIVAILAWEISDEQKQAEDVALSEARSAWQKDAAIRHWDADVGGVYVPVGDKVHPDPLLANQPDRDATTSSGKKLTLLNPAAIIRNIQDVTHKEFKIRGHLTSLRPIDPAHMPDAWEKQSLESFEHGVPETYGIETIAGEPYLRLMRPLMMEESCLKCHAEQGHKVGEIRGGISVAVPMAKVWPSEREQIAHRLIGYLGMWGLGLAGVVILSRQLSHQAGRRYDAEQRLRETNEMLEQRVADRTAELATVNRELQVEIADRKQAELWLLESEQRFRGCFELQMVGLALLSADQEWVEVNQQLCHLLGYIEEDLVGETWLDLAPPAERAAEEDRLRRTLNGQMKGYEIDRQFLRKDGSLLNARLSVQCLRKEDGSVDCLLAAVQVCTG